ncbi:ATP-binding protein [Streptomyces sp. NPDC002994]|uniref:ATP-binding protein n=1 Tax=Streptomyces sp. NPDC002994 TaxID=3154441 RepID=UPI0033AD603C
MHARWTLPTQCSQVQDVIDDIQHLLAASPAEIAALGNLLLAVREGLVNAVRHGCGGYSALAVTMQVTATAAGGITVRLPDPGRGFDPAAVPDPTLPEGRGRPHGRGLFMRHLTDSVDYVFPASGGTLLTLTAKPANAAPARTRESHCPPPPVNATT